MKITKSYADCKSCSLVNANSVLIDSNSMDDVSKVDIVFLADFPTEKDLQAEKPLQNEAFREFLDMYIIGYGFKYLIVNSVCCNSFNNGKSEITTDVILRCKKNAFHFIEKCNPKVIMTLGKIPMQLMKIKGSLEENIGKIFDLGKSKVLVNSLPQTENTKEEFKLSFAKAMTYIIPKEVSVEKEIDDLMSSNGPAIQSIKVDESYAFRIPAKYYTDEYRLVDIQLLNNNQLLYIFRDKNNNKETYLPPTKDYNYYWYEGTTPAVISHVKDTELKISNYGNRARDGHVYESDISIVRKQAVDYYYRNEGEALTENLNVLFYDIEVYTGSYRGFPDPSAAKFPINAISFRMNNGPTYMFLLVIAGKIDPRWKLLKDDARFKNVVYFTEEDKLLLAFIKAIHQFDPDFMCGWNTGGFDNPYIFNRCKKLGIDVNRFSKFNYSFVDAKRMICRIAGAVPLDQLWLYKNLTYSNEPSYKLENISQKVLKRGKKQYDGDLMKLYEADIFTFCEYSITDTDLLFGLEDKLGHVALQDELRAASTTTHDGAASTIGLADGLFNFDLKSKNVVMRNGNHGREKRSIVGAYVRDPEAGIYNWVVDFDYTSLYPSIICTFNIGPNTFVGKMAAEDAHEYIFNRNAFFAKTTKLTITLDPTYNSTPTSITREEFRKIVDKYKAIVSPYGTVWKGHEVEKSIFYDIIKKLFKQRKLYKGMMFEAKKAGNETAMKSYNNKQMSYKILLNSLYGIMANEHFRFYNPDLAETVTMSGQHLIKFAGEHADQWMQYRLKGNTDYKININPDYFEDVESTKDFLKYCDTDSLFLHMEPYLEGLNLECNPDNIAEQTKYIGEYLNKNLLPHLARMFNVTDEESMLDIKNELICRRYYTLDMKKKYALHVIRQEGVDTDEIEIKGLEIKRSDFSESTKDMLNELVELILRDDDFDIDKAEAMIDKHRTKIMNDVVDGKPEAFKTVAFSKPESEYKVMPQHLKGMKIWNDMEYDFFRYGNRGALIPIRGIDIGNAPQHVIDNYNKVLGDKWSQKDLDVIVIPEDLEKVPDYYIIDIQRVMQFAVEDRVDILMKPLARKSSICIF